jgi:uncharacterized protein (DUF362 family)
MKIALKVNMMMHVKPDKAATVHPQVASSLCALLIERGASVVVGDSPGGPFSAAYLTGVYSTTGMWQVLETGATLNDDFSIQDVSYPEAVSAKEFQVTNYLAQADAIIDLCKMKTHGLMATPAHAKIYLARSPVCESPSFITATTRTKHLQHAGRPLRMVQAAPFDCGRRHDHGGKRAFGGAPRFMGAILASFNPHALDLAGAH